MLATKLTAAVGLSMLLAALAVSATAVDTDRLVRGVQDAHLPHFKGVTDTFTCLNQQHSVPASHVNDEFCDCPDGSDEPGSAACTLRLKKPTNWKFRCANKGYSGKEVPHSRVNDRICDCCDGSDEYGGFVKCENTCAKAAEAEEKEAREREALRQAGLKAREEMINAAKGKKEAKRAELAAKLRALEESEGQLSALEAAKNEAETKEKAEREIIYEKSKAEHAKWKEAQELKRRQQEEEAASSAAPDNATATDAPAVVVPTESGALPPAFVCSSWRQTKNCRGDGEREPTYDKSCDEVIASGSSGYCACIDTSSGEEKTFSKDCGHSKLTCTYVCEHDGSEPDDLAAPEAPPREEEFKIDDGSSFELDEAREARRKHNDLKTQRSDDQRSVEELQRFVDGSYGPEDALLSLMDDCVEKDDGREYTYKLCPFKDVTQNKRGGYGSTNMGRWKGWGEQTYSSWGSKQDYSRMVFEGGDHCYSAGARQTEVHVVCGPESKLISIEEPSMCKYKLLFQTPGVCE